MTKAWLNGSLFVVALLAFVAVGIDYFNIVFNTTTRWVFLALLIASLLPHGDILAGFRSRFAPFLMVYLLWCLTTGIWSDVPILSVEKAAAFAVVATAFLGAGHAWVNRQQPQRPLFFLLAVVIAAVFAGLAGHRNVVKLNTGITVYQGLSGNPNYLGILAAVALPLPLYQVYQSWKRKESALWLGIWSTVTITLALLLWWSGSRASMLCAVMILLAFGLVLSAGRRLSMGIVLIAIVSGTAIAAPEVEQGVYQRVVVKNAKGSDAFVSRREPWEKTYEGAQKGGFFGLGYGVSAGFGNFSLGLTANNYGREKGNAQLAVWEETGLVGLVFYAMLIVTLFAELISGVMGAPDQDSRVAAALLLGTAAGLVAQSVFEAWWTAPGSMESAMFWSAVGVASAFSQRRAAGVKPNIERGTPLAFQSGASRTLLKT